MKRLAAAALIAIAFLLIMPATVFADSTIDFVSPNGTEGVIPECTDYATHRFSDPWDMSNSSDGGLFDQNFRNKSMSGGYWSGYTNNTGGHFWPQWGGYPGSYANGREGAVNGINTSYYKRFTVKMYLNKGPKQAVLWWFRKRNLTDKGYTIISVRQGWGIYQVDLPASWYGTVIGMRFDPINISDTHVLIDWIRLTPTSADDDFTIRWDDGGGPQGATVYLDNNNYGYDGAVIDGNTYTTPGTNEYALDTSGLAPGNYYVYIRTDDGELSPYSDGPIRINQTPIFKITDPDRTGGTDWAARYLHNAWNMSQFSDATRYRNIGLKRINKGIFGGTNTTNDPYMWMRLGGKKINTSVYRYATFKFKYAGSFDLKRGTMARFCWKSAGHGWNVSDDIVTYDGRWRTFTVDLKKIALNGGSYGWRGYTELFRFDPNEDRYRRRFYIDYIKIAAEDYIRYSGGFSIKFNKNDSDHSSATLRLYRDADKVPNNGNEVLLTTQTISNGNGSFYWYPSNSYKGRVWIYGEVDDGINTDTYYASGLLRVHM